MSDLLKTVIQLAICVIILLAVVGIVYLFLNVTGIVLPSWVWALGGLVIAVIACIYALRWLKTQV